MVGEMLHGFAGFVVMDRTMGVVVMMGRANQMVYLMGNIVCLRRRAQPALHGKAMHGQQQHEKNANDTSHENELH